MPSVGVLFELRLQGELNFSEELRDASGTEIEHLPNLLEGQVFRVVQAQDRLLALRKRLDEVLEVLLRRGLFEPLEPLRPVLAWEHVEHRMVVVLAGPREGEGETALRVPEEVVILLHGHSHVVGHVLVRRLLPQHLPERGERLLHRAHLLALLPREHIDRAEVVDDVAPDAPVRMGRKLGLLRVVVVEGLKKPDNPDALQVLMRGKQVIGHANLADDGAHEGERRHHDGLSVRRSRVVEVLFDKGLQVTGHGTTALGRRNESQGFRQPGFPKRSRTAQAPTPRILLRPTRHPPRRPRRAPRFGRFCGPPRSRLPG